MSSFQSILKSYPDRNYIDLMNKRNNIPFYDRKLEFTSSFFVSNDFIT